MLSEVVTGVVMFEQRVLQESQKLWMDDIPRIKKTVVRRMVE